jgi:hypothetical protein
MRLRVLDDLGGAKLSEISKADLQDLADRMLADGLDPSTIRNTFMPLRALFRRAMGRELAVNPNGRARTTRCPRAPRTDRITGRGREAHRGIARRRTRSVGDRVLRRPSTQ